jgi:hypothetical protein
VAVSLDFCTNGKHVEAKIIKITSLGMNSIMKTLLPVSRVLFILSEIRQIQLALLRKNLSFIISQNFFSQNLKIRI